MPEQFEKNQSSKEMDRLKLIHPETKKEYQILRKGGQGKEKPLESEKQIDSLEIKKEKEIMEKMLEGKEVAEKIGAIKREIGDKLLPIRMDISGIKEVFENMGKKKAQDYLNKCNLDLQEIKRIDIWLERLESIVEESKNLEVLKIFQKKLNEIKRNLESDKFKLIIESFIKKDLNRLFKADRDDYFENFEKEVKISLEEVEKCFKR